MIQAVSSPPRRRTLLVIMDGIGVNPSKQHNAWHLAATPRLDDLLAHHPHTLIETAGRAVGLPDGQMGNSEVGHLTLGCGTIIRQDLVRIDDAIADGSIADNPALVAAIDAARQADRPLHLLGLVSDGGVHSHLRHLLALVHLCGQHGVRPVVHMITDGRDTAPRCAASYLQDLEPALNAADGYIASVCGRYFAMDRDKRWDRIKLAFDLVVHGVGKVADSARGAIEDAYQCGETDEFIKPRLIHQDGCIRPGDAVAFFNFRNDRPRQLTEALSQAGFQEFDRGEFRPIQVTCLTLYDRRFDLPVAFLPERPELTLAKVISEAGLSQFHCAETEKYPHVTFFFNGGVEKPAVGEEHVMIPSPPVATYDLQPEMSAPGVADATIGALRAKRDFVLVNFANGDMVGHTAIPEAVIAAVEAVDSAVGRLVDAALEEDYSIIITADHGNCEEMVDPVSGEPHTQHTVYPVACIVVDPSGWRLRTGGGLSDIAATVLMLMGLNKPEGMSGRSLLID